MAQTPPDTHNRFEIFLRVCADNAASLRRCDLERALEIAAGEGDLEAFVPWLCAQRPDLYDAIHTIAAEIAPAD